ncbi:DUF6134 family protein [Roseospirillum parvum]|uniref:Uncharacterized protein n=1 Tax=Roseospirillum parvum TaxID=83401 RepID=A0A1G7XXB1_9PROT|nr:DUF6134 family protein [Roseospirillum parvum]SDG88791.1 hypothetical protein SAMN05421742_103128 [Roseospirillum parvum]
MRPIPILLAAALLLPALPAAAEPQLAAARDPLGTYGDRAVYQVVREGTPIGRHVVHFSRVEDGGLRVKAETDIDVGVFGLTLYRFQYVSNALWRDGQLIEMMSRTDDDGDLRQVEARRDSDGQLEVRGPNGVWRAGDPAYPTNHWNPQVVADSPPALINTLNGKRAEITLTRLGEASVPCGGTTCPAEAWRYEGDFAAKVFYDRAGRWLGMSFSARDGSRIDYVCQSCRPDSLATLPPDPPLPPEPPEARP